MTTRYVVEVTRSNSRSFSSDLVVNATYTCHSDGEVLDLEGGRESPLKVTYGINPNCNSNDDSGTVHVEVSDPGADVRSCPKYVLTARAEPSYL